MQSNRFSSNYFSQRHWLFTPLRKNIGPRKITVNVFQDKWFGRFHRCTINLFIFWKVDFLSFKGRPNINLYVEYSWTYDFSRIQSSLIREGIKQRGTCKFPFKVGALFLLRKYKHQLHVVPCLRQRTRREP